MRTKISLLALSLASMFVIVSCGQTGDANKNDGPPTSNKQPIIVTSSQLASLKDPVCGMDLTFDINNNKLTDTAVYNGAIYPFCSDGCKTAFKKEPTKYITKK